MKKKLLLFLALAIVASCGPHRMKCGARGICENPQPNTSTAA